MQVTERNTSLEQLDIFNLLNHEKFDTFKSNFSIIYLFKAEGFAQ